MYLGNLRGRDHSTISEGLNFWGNIGNQRGRKGVKNHLKIAYDNAP
jgi:hypothetical protein